MIQLAFFFAFLGFLFVAARAMLSRGRRTFENYRLSITHQFDEAERLLREAKNLFEKAQQNHDCIAEQTNQILGLGRLEVAFILEKSEAEMTACRASGEHLFLQQSQSIRNQWEQELLADLWKNIYHHTAKVTEKCSSQKGLSFIESRLYAISSQPLSSR